MTRFVILAAPRTGSNLLCTLLNSHPQVLCHHEVFNPQGVFTAHDYHGDTLNVDSLRQRDDDPLGFLERVWQTGGDDMCVGFKSTRGQDQQVLKNVLEDAGVKKIVLRRRNRIKTYVSERIAQATHQWEVYSQHDLMLPRPRIHVDAAELKEHIASNQRFYAEIMAALSCPSQPHLEIDYESLFERGVQVRMFEFLEVDRPETPPIPGSVKQNPTDLRDTIANFAELASCLSDGDLITELFDLGM